MTHQPWKYLHDEEGTDIVTPLIENIDNDVWISELAFVELVSALHKKHRAGVLSKREIALALDGFAETRSPSLLNKREKC